MSQLLTRSVQTAVNSVQAKPHSGALFHRDAAGRRRTAGHILTPERRPRAPVEYGRRFSKRGNGNTLTTCASAGHSSSSGGADDDRGLVIVLGGNGFVGSAAVKAAATRGYDVVSVSRRGAPASLGAAEPWQARVRWEKGDLVANPDIVLQLLRDAKEGNRRIKGVIHAIGMLLESEANAIASGSGSVPSEGSTYDEVTRKTALAAAAAVVDKGVMGPLAEEGRPTPFVFVSAAEAGWTESLGGDPFFTPDFLRRYLVAKRAVEAQLLEYGTQGLMRPAILRPSLVYTPDRLPSLPAVAAFTVGNALGIPGIDRPVLVQTLAQAAVAALADEDVSGILDFKKMETLAGSAECF